MGVSSTHSMPFRVGNKVRREIASVELHSFDDFERGLHGPRFLDGDDAVLTHFLHRIRDEASDLLVGVGADRAHLRDHVALDVAGDLLDLCNAGFYGFLDATLQRHRACARRNRPNAFAENRLGQHSRGGGAVAGYIGGLGRHFAHHLCAHVFERILQLDFLRHGHAVLGDDRRAKLFFDHSVATPWGPA